MQQTLSIYCFCGACSSLYSWRFLCGLVYVKGLGYPFCIPLNLISFFADKKKLKRIINYVISKLD